MVDEDLLERLEQLPAVPFEGCVFRHTIANQPWDKENVRGARWNPPDVAALYTSLERDTTIGEGDHLLEVQSILPVVRRVVHRIQVRLEKVIDLRTEGLLPSLGVDEDELGSDDHWACRRIGEAADRLALDGIIVPSARRDGGSNLILFSRNSHRDVEHLGEEVIYDPEAE